MIKILDRYVARNFLFGYFIALFVMLGLFMTIDLFINMDEFAEHSNQGVGFVVMNIVRFYSVRCCLWYKELAGMVIVVASVFSLTRMTRNNELIAVMASGMSLKRILAPILFLSVLLTGLMIVDQEFVIPRLANLLTRSHDDTTDEAAYDIWFIGDDKGSLICSRRYEESTRTLYNPLIILREPTPEDPEIYHVYGQIKAEKAVYDKDKGAWLLHEGRYIELPGPDKEIGQSLPKSSYESTLTPDEIPIRRREGYKNLLSLRQLSELERQGGTRRTDMAELALQKHSRITDPMINLIMLMVALPVLVCRDPRAMKTAILISFVTTGSCFLLVFLCKLFATEVFLGQIRPAIWAWVPIFIFFPIALIEIDSMRT